jgi:Putative peptidoglycan binding domain
MPRITGLTLVLVALLAAQVLADEQTRRAQEELRRRNLYFGDIDGRSSAEFTGALKRYQTRKGLEATGQVNEETAKSLNIPLADSQKVSQQQWPDLPVLKSDVARAIPESQRAGLQEKAEASDPTPAPSVPAEPPTSGQSVTPDQVTKLVENYLHDAELDDVAAQVRYYGFPIEYFDHGSVDQSFVTKDTLSYCKRWPQRKYTLMAPVAFAASSQDEETLVEFTIAFTVKNQKHTATGHTKNFWTIKPAGNKALKIVAIREERLRE